MLTTQRSAPLLLFAAAAIGIYGIALYLRAILPHLEHSGALAAGITLDLTVLVPALWYVLVVRRKGWKWISVVPVAVASVLLAAWVVPAEHHRTLNLVEIALIPLELALLAYVGLQAFRGIRRIRERATEADAVTALRAAATDAIHHRGAARAVAYELSVFYYGLASWFRPRYPSTHEFTSHNRDAYASVLVGLMMVMAIEIIPVHLLLDRWTPVAAWIVTGLSIYGAVWLLADFQAFRRRPIRIEPDALYLRVGLRFEAVVPRADVLSLETTGSDEELEDSTLKLKVLGPPNMRLRTRRPVEVSGMYGLGRSSDDIAFTLDEPQRFLEAWSASNPTPID